MAGRIVQTRANLLFSASAPVTSVPAARHRHCAMQQLFRRRGEKGAASRITATDADGLADMNRTELPDTFYPGDAMLSMPLPLPLPPSPRLFCCLT
jgi:hypothetical protein